MRLFLFEECDPFVELLHRVIAEACQFLSCVFDGQFLVEVRFREKFIGVANQLLLYRHGAQIAVWQRHIQAFYLFERDACACVAFAHKRVAWQPLVAHQFRTEIAMFDVVVRAETENFWRVSSENTDVVEHGGFGHKHRIDAEFSVPRSQLQRLVAHRQTVPHQRVVQRRTGRVVFRYDFEWIQFLVSMLVILLKRLLFLDF